MKKITLLIVSIFTIMTELNAKYTEELFTVDPTGLTPKELKRVDTLVEKILTYKTPTITPTTQPAEITAAVPDMTAHFFQTLVLVNCMSLAHLPEQPRFVYNFLNQDIGNFKALVAYVASNKKGAAEFLNHFRIVYNTETTQLKKLLTLEIESCNFALRSFESKENLGEANKETITRLVNIEREQLETLQIFLEDNIEADACVTTLRELNAKQISMLKKLTPFLIIAATGGAVYLYQNYGDYIANLATQFLGTVSQFASDHTPDMLRGTGSAIQEGASSALGWGQEKLSSAVSYLPSMPSLPSWSSTELIETAKSMFTLENGKALLNSAINNAFSIKGLAVGALGGGYAGYRLHRRAAAASLAGIEK